MHLSSAEPPPMKIVLINLGVEFDLTEGSMSVCEHVHPNQRITADCLSL